MESTLERLRTIETLIIRNDEKKEDEVKRLLVEVKKDLSESELDDILTYWVKYQLSKKSDTRIVKVMERMIEKYNIN